MSISEIIGTDKFLDEIKRILIKEEKCAIEITGLPGRGKTWIAENLEEYLTGTGYCCIRLSGDRASDYDPFYPLKRFVEKRDATYNKGVTVVKETVSEIPYLGKGIRVLLEGYDYRKQKLRKTINEIAPFNKYIPFSTHLIGLLRKYPKTIILCDDIEYFDTATLEFLASLDEGFAELGMSHNLLFIVFSVDNTHIFLSYGRKYSFHLPALTAAQVKKALQYWSAKEISEDDFAFIFSSTGDHLQLLKIVSHYLIENKSHALNYNFKEFLVWVIESRLRLAKDKYEKFKSIIFAIYQSGKKSSITELLCMLNENKDLREVLQQAIQMNILTLKDNYIHFTHPIVENYALSLKANKPDEFYEKLASCTRKLTPSDYARRAIIEKMAKQNDQADIYWTLAGLQRIQQGAFEDAKIISEYITESHLGIDLKLAINQFETAYSYSLKGVIDEAIIETEQISNSLPKLIVAEKYYLKCQNLAKRISDEPKKEALRIIEEWEDLKDDETEIWYRFVQLKIIIASELYQPDLALKTEAEIIKCFSARLTFDKHARPILERLNSFSEVLYSPEVAHKKMLQSEERLTKYVLGEQYHLLSDLYMARTNLSSNCFMIDKFQKSIQFATSVISLVADFPEIRFPYTEVAHNNLYLSLLFSDFSQLDVITEEYEKLYKGVTPQENKILIDINYAGLLLLNEKANAALEVLNSSEYIPKIGSDNHYYSYYFWCNYSLVTFLSGDQNQASKMLTSLEGIPDKISPFLKNYYNTHYQLIKEIIIDSKIKSYSSVKNYIRDKQLPFSGRTWERFNVGYLFTDMQIWTSS